MHILKISREGGVTYFTCECGRPLTFLQDGYSEMDLSEVVHGHRLHVRMELNVPATWREGSTTQRHAPIDPLAEPDLKPTLTSAASNGQTDGR